MPMQAKSLRTPHSLRAALAVAIAVGTGGLAAEASAAASPAAARSALCSASITKENFGAANSGPYGGRQTVWRYTLANRHCMQVRIITYGATVQSIRVPDRRGHMADVALGFKTLADYVALASPPPTSPNAGGPYFGETIGRYANRIGGASFNLNGTRYTLPVNNGANTLHGGFMGWGNRVWQRPVATSARGGVSLMMTLVLPNGDEGSGLLPGTKVYEARSFTPTDAGLIPTGAVVPVRGTTFDFRSFQSIGARIGDARAPAGNQLVLAHGYDHNWVLSKSGPMFDGLRFAAAAFDPRSGRLLNVWTDQPGVQFYAGNFFDGHLVGISGHTYRQSVGYTFETQHFPDSPNLAKFPSTVLKAGKTFNSTTSSHSARGRGSVLCPAGHGRAQAPARPASLEPSRRGEWHP